MAAFPSSIGIVSLDMRIKHAVSISESPFSFKQKSHDFGGARWEAEVTTQPLTHSQAREMEAFIFSLGGMAGTFTFGNPLDNVAGTHSIAPTGVGEGHVSFTSQTALPAGTRFAIGNNLHITTEDYDGSGIGNTNVAPPLRSTINVVTNVVTAKPKGLWRMASNDMGFSVTRAGIYGFSFACVEAL